MVALLDRTVSATTIEKIRVLARKRLPLGEMAQRLDMELETIRTIADLNGIEVVRDNRTGAARPKLAHKAAASGYVATLRQGFVARQEHMRRIAQARDLTPEEEAAAIARFLETKGVTKCPTVHLEASDEMVGLDVGRKRKPPMR